MKNGLWVVNIERGLHRIKFPYFIMPAQKISVMLTPFTPGKHVGPACLGYIGVHHDMPFCAKRAVQVALCLQQLEGGADLRRLRKLCCLVAQDQWRSVE